MKHNYLNNTPLEQAQEIFFGAVAESGFSYTEETARVPDALGRSLSRAVYAVISSPHYNASAMDGIAVKAADTFGAAERTPVILTPSRYTVVDTGDPLPDGADAVIMVEDVIEAGDGSVKLYAAAAPWQHVRQVGEDICMGDMIAPTNTVVTPALIGAFLAGGVTEIAVKKRPLFGIIPTGDEIVPPTSAPEKGEIIEFNSAVFAAMLAGWDADAKTYPIVKDKKELLSAALETALAECDAVLVLAGSSAGRDDYTAEIVSALGKVTVHGVAIRPGKPAVLGVAKGKPVAGLPGYPVSAIVVMEEFIKGLIDRYYKRPPQPEATAQAVLGRRVTSSLKYREYLRVSLGGAGGKLTATPLPGGAGVISSLTKADAILTVEQDAEGLEAGESVSVRLLRDRRDVENALIVTGSHDPIIDELADLAQRQGCGFRVKSSHVGSMGTIAAIRAGQAHMGAIHLLDGDTGTYNVPYVEKYFPEGGAVLFKGVKRVQGFMVAPGNPLGIRTIADLTRCRYVNRQRGAGTRVLLDHLMERDGVMPDRIDGYANEKFTHTAVAASIAAGNADAGLGIWSAAKMYGLDFIPLCDEEYDFLVNETYADHPFVRAFFELLHSDAFAKRLTEMGGYKI
ncbi:MAG: molybdopterin biosynthesis protein [Clostridia bacterium]|nr:molybdopterin biosynthesis protein [Clostridia bacterium]